jgi:hypothetical protein
VQAACFQRLAWPPLYRWAEQLSEGEDDALVHVAGFQPMVGLVSPPPGASRPAAEASLV